MGTADLRGRLAALPGVISATVGDETVALLLRADADPRLLKARAQAICAEMGETRPLVVLGGRAAAGALAGSRGAGSGSRGRRTTPVTMALASAFVLSAVVLAPGESNRPNPLSRRPPSGSVALAPLPPGPAHEAVASPALSAPPATLTGSTPPTFVQGLAPLPSLARSAAAGAGPLLVGLGTAGAAAGPAAPPAPGFSSPIFGPQLASAGPSMPRPVEPGQAAAPRRPTQPTATAGPKGKEAPAEPVADAPAPLAETRTSSPEIAASVSDDAILSASAVDDRRLHRRSGDRDRRSYVSRQISRQPASRATEPLRKAGKPEEGDKGDPADDAPKAVNADNAGDGGNTGNAGVAGDAGNSGNRADRADRDDRIGRWGGAGNTARTARGGLRT